ncbi:protein PAF1 homolog [Rosa rugosa]|uniref:protein PAF1 homolog n=1 Tax=Rosa rugosa TaxID=74645 RepID=UPI002B40F048|nr:protein PAF1 homolog [Rosa rugosa]
MASYRPFPPQPAFPPPPPNQNPIAPPPRGNQYNQNWGYNAGGGGGDGAVPAAPSSYPQNYIHHPHSNYGPPRAQHPHPPPQYSYPPPPPPPPDSSYPPPPPPQAPPGKNMPLQPPQAPMYYQSNSQYAQYSHQAMQPPPPPPPPLSPSSSIPPPPPPPNSPPPPPPPQSRESGFDKGPDYKGASKEVGASAAKREHGHSNHHGIPHKHKPPVPLVPVKKSNGPPGRVETEEERRLRKKREFEKQRQEEKHRQQLKESQNSVLQKTHMLSSGKGHGSIAGSRMGERRATPFLSGERAENRLKKPTTFVCKLKFRNELPDPSAQPKLMSMKKDKDQYTKYTITSLEKNYKPKLFVEPDLGIPLDLLDLSVYNPPPGPRPPLAPEDEELLRDDVAVTPVKKDGIRRKERPTDKGVAWLVKTQYISPLSMDSAKQSLTEKQAKELREMKGGRNLLDNLNDRERQIKEIEASFEACKSRPVHATNKNLYPVEILPLLPDFERYDDQFVLAAFDGAPTADSEIYSKLDQSDHDVCESRAIMKSYKVTGADPANPDKFLAYMVPSPNELSKNPYDESEDVSYSWVREYQYDVRGDDVDDLTTYLVSFDEDEARYAPLPAKLVLRKKRAKEGRSTDEVEHFPAPSRVTVRRRSTVSAIELKDAGDYSRGALSNSKRRGFDNEDALERPQKRVRHQDVDEYSGGDDDLSD